MKTSSETYTKLSKSKFLKKNVPTVYIYEPSEQDYKIGIIKRYFAKKIGRENLNFIEIDLKTYNNFQNNELYSVIGFDWKISGKKNSWYDDKKNFHIGVEEFNTNSLKNANKKLFGIYDYLKSDLFKFWKGI